MPPCRALFAAALAALVAGPLVAPRTRAETFPVCVAHGDQLNVDAIGDGAGGAYLAWKDGRNGADADVFVLRMKADGQVVQGWSANGRRLSLTILPEAWPRLASDGEGGVIAVWGVTGWEVRAQRLSGIGQELWGTGGALVNPNSPVLIDASFTAIAPDGAGGAYVAWMRNPDARAFVTRLNAAGQLAGPWSVPLDVSGSLTLTRTIALVPDGAGGVFVLRNARSPWHSTSVDLFFRRYSTFASVYPEPGPWGRLVGSILGDADHVQAMPDGEGGLWVTWDDTRSGNADIVLTRLNGDGTPHAGWPDSGLVVCAQPGAQLRPKFARTSEGGVVMAWTDRRDGNDDVTMLRVGPDGTRAPGWPANGLRVASGPAQQNAPAMQLLPDGSVLLAWVTNEAGTSDVRAARVLAGGSVTSSVAVAAEPGWNETDPLVVRGPGDEATVIWRDWNTGEPAPDLRASLVNVAVPLAAEPAIAPRLALAGAAPHPARVGAVRVSFTLPDAAPARLELYDVAGRRLASRDVGVRGAGTHAVTFDEPLAPGLVFARLTSGGDVRTARVVIAR